jgi:hypothetical protein
MSNCIWQSTTTNISVKSPSTKCWSSSDSSCIEDSRFEGNRCQISIHPPYWQKLIVWGCKSWTMCQLYYTILQWKCNFTAEHEISIKKPKLGILAKSDAHNGIYWPCVAVWTTGVKIKHYCEKPGNQWQRAYNQRGTFSKQWKSLKY